MSRKKVADSDVIINLLTKTQGKIRVYVNGARHPKSRFSSSVQPFVEGNYSIAIRKALSTLSESSIVTPHLLIREDIERLFLGTYMLELVELSLEDGDFVKGLYDRVTYALKMLETTPDLKLLKIVYDLKMIQLLGYEPSLFSCSSCGVNDNLLPALSSVHGGVLCADCIKTSRDYTRFTLEDLKWINIALKTPYSTIQANKVDDTMLLKLDKWLNTFIETHVVRRPLKSLSVIKNM